MSRRTWIKIFCDNWLRGSIRREPPEVRAIFIDLLAMAGDSAFGENGEIKLANGVGFSDEVIAGILNVQLEMWLNIKKELSNCKDKNEIRINIIKQKQGFSIKIINWSKYQSEYSRQKEYRKVTKEVTRGVTKNKQKRCGVDIDIEVDVDVDVEEEEDVKPNITSTKKKKKTNPDIKIFIDDFFNTFQDKTGAPYLVSEKDGKLVQRLLGTYTLTQLQFLKDKFFDSQDKWILKAGYSIGIFSSVIHKLISGKTDNYSGIKQWLTEMESKVEK